MVVGFHGRGQRRDSDSTKLEDVRRDGERLREMTLADYYDRVINWPDQGWLAIGLSAGVVILCIAAILLYFGKFRRFARAIGIVGCFAIMVVLWDVREQTVTEKQGRRVTVTTMRFSPQIRRATTAALVALPTAAAVVMSMVFTSTRRRLRARVPGHLKAGRRHLVNKDYSAALHECNQAIETAPDLAEGYYRRGAVLQAMGDLSHALEDFDVALEHDPRLASAYLQRGKIHTENGSLDLAARPISSSSWCCGPTIPSRISVVESASSRRDFWATPPPISSECSS